MDEQLYNKNKYKKYQEHEALCKRCGACCGVKEEDPCEHLNKDANSVYFCDIYESRFGLRKTRSGEPVMCVPIRNMLDKSWWGRSGCAYIRFAKNVLNNNS